MNEKEFFDTLKSDLQAIVDTGIKYASNTYNDFSHEIYIINTKSLDISINAGMVDAKAGGQVGVGVRSVKDKKVGFASASGISDESVNFAIDAAVNLSKSLTEADDRWTGFVSDKRSGKDGILDDKILEYSSEEAVDGANKVFHEAKEFDKRIISVSGSTTISYGGFAIGNTEGLSKASRYTYAVGTSYITAKAGDKTKNAFDYIMSREVPSFDGIGTSGAKKAIDLLESKPLGKTSEMTVVFDQLTAGQFIQTGLGNSINGKSVLEGRSIWADRMGDNIGIKGLNIYDNPQIPEDPGMQAIDAEGFPREPIKIIDDGVLKSFIFDKYNADAHGSENTGNASRNASQSFEAAPGISTSTITLDPGSKSIDKLLEEAGDGVYITGFLMGISHSNLISGDFSIVSPSAYRIENGELAGAIDSITIAGNLYKSFNQLVNIGNEKDLTFVGKIPSLAYDGFTVSG